MKVNDTDNGSVDRFIGESEIKKITSLSRSTRWRLEREGRFPKKRHLSANRIGWLQSEILEWIESRANTAPIEPESGAA
ncbi:MAG: AlpA family phage regulatory protein [Alphaproteobacteria bacterium]|nr:AlpA family phage regulatory protein [Alphaproteobacteria bacterium]